MTNNTTVEFLAIQLAKIGDKPYDNDAVIQEAREIDRWCRKMDKNPIAEMINRWREKRDKCSGTIG